jgi:predicted AAA+ superfamily ATPase
MTTMYSRYLSPPDRSFFLLGPRGTGKSTWLDQHFPNAALRIDLLNESTYLDYLSNPEALRNRVEAIEEGGWVVIDEVQRVPALLNEVHSLLFKSKKSPKFCLTGSSARKLRRVDSNMLAGRALSREFFPLAVSEIGPMADISRLIAFGSLPAVYSHPKEAVDLLDAYVSTYIQTEIQQEAATRNLPAFTRFLKAAALMNGQVVNVAGLARDVGVKRPTVERYFQILVDTLIGFWLPGWQPRVKVREKLSPKFYLFDAGVGRAILQRTRDEVREEERGALLETLVLNELRSAMNSLNCGGELSYYRTSEKSEVDLIWSRGDLSVGIEVKASNRWRSEFGRTLGRLKDEGAIARGIGIYLGSDKQRAGGIDVLPLRQFAEELSRGEVLTAVDK